MAGNTDPTKMRIGIIGMGAIGSTMAAHLIDADAFVVPCDIDRDKIDAMKESGIRLENKIEKVVDVDDVCYSAHDLGKYDLDLVIVSVKTPSLKKVVTMLAEALPDKTFVMCAQNGLDNEKEVADVVGDDRTLRMSINFAGGMSTLNTVHVAFFNPPNYIAAMTPDGEAIIDRISGLLNSVNLATEVPDDIQKHVWKKAILNTALSSVCAITGLTMKDVMDSPNGLETVEAILNESIAVAAAEGFTYGDDFLEFCLTYLKGGGYHKPSMLVDLENGLLTEIDYLNGRIAKYGQKHGLPTPVNTTITALVHLLEQGSK
jgi:2-dehydropantoate 2-reductase